MGSRRIVAVCCALLGVALVAAPAYGTSPGENGKIAFSRFDGGPRQVRVVNPDGSGNVQLPVGTADEPAWSWKGDKLAFRCWDGNSEVGICASNADGSGRVVVGGESGSNFRPTWSRDGSDIVFSNFPDVHFTPVSLWRMDADGQDHIFLRDGGDADWSPDGTRIAYVTINDTNTQIAVMNADNTGGTTLTDASADNESPSWSPDGTIAFTSNRDGNKEIYVIDPNGGVETRLTNTAAHEEFPDFSPDGRKIVFSSFVEGGDRDLYVMNADGTGVTQLTNDPGSSDQFPDWQAIQRGYPRPKGATPLRVSLVPAFEACAQPNRTHGPPLAFGSCNPPAVTGHYGTIGQDSVGHVRFDVRPGVDVSVALSLTDVSRQSDGTDLTGSLELPLDVRITDKTSAVLGVGGGTTVNPNYFTNPLRFEAPCAPTADPAVGSTCSVQSSLDALAPGTRAVVELGRITVYDGGDDGAISSRDDNTPLAVQGVFVP